MKEKHQEYCNSIEIWDAIQKAFITLTQEEVASMNNIVVKAIDLGESYMLIRVENEYNGTSRDVESISVSGCFEKTMQKVADMAYEDEFDYWKEKKRRQHSVWCFKLHWDEEE